MIWDLVAPAGRRRHEVSNSISAESLESAMNKREGLEFPLMLIYKFVRMVVNTL